jgi:phospholipid-binding lipoprotein MlaA
MRHQRNLLPIVGLLTLLGLITGCASTPNGDPGDPYEATNRKIYNFNDSIDRNVLQPVARGYVKVAPKPVLTSSTMSVTSTSS